MLNLFRVPVLTKPRIYAAFLVAMAVDAIQLALGPAGWVFIDQILDLAAAALMVPLIGFHPLLLPTFVLEAMPVADMVPTWTACVGIVVALRRRQMRTSVNVPPRVDPSPIIDV